MADLLVTALKWVVKSMKPLADPGVRSEILQSVGAPPSEKPPELLSPATYERLEQIATTPDSELFAEITALASGAGDLLSVIDSLRDGANALKLGDQMGVTDLSVEEFVRFVPNVMAMNTLRINVPGLWSIFKMLQFLDEKASVPFGSTFSWGAFKGLFVDDGPEGTGFRWGRDTEDERDFLAITIGIAAILFGKFGGKLLGSDLSQGLRFHATPGWDPSPHSKTPRADHELLRTTTLDLIFGPTPKDFAEAEQPWNESRTLSLTFLVPPKPISTPLIVSGEGEVSIGRTFGNFKAELSARFPTSGGYEVRLKSDSQTRLDPITLTQYLTLGQLGVEAWLSSEGHGIRLKALGNSLNLTGKGERDPITGAALEGNDVRSTFDLDVTLDSTNGFRFGASGIRLNTPLNLKVGPATVTSAGFTFGLGKENGGIELTATVGLKFKLGPLTAAAEGLGFELLAPSKDFGNLGVAHLEKAGLKPPDGIGLSLDAKVAKGSGYLGFDRASQQYFGAFEVKLTERYKLQITGLLATKMPDGSKGLSLFLQGSLQMKPGWVVFGLEITRIGVMYGYQRRFDLEAFRAGFKTGMVETLLAPADPLANIGQTVAQLTAMFPVAKGKHTAAISVRVERNAVSFDLGLLYDTSEPYRIVTVGLLQIDCKKAGKFKLAALGVFDFGRGEIMLQASIFDSKLGGVSVSGDAAMLIRWKSPRTFVISIGGFHPGFRGPEKTMPVFDKLQRFTLKLKDTPVLKVSMSAYFAVTTNSVQLGASVAVWVGIENLVSLDGDFSFDALFEFDPFYFDIAVKGRVGLKVFGETIGGVRFEGRFYGPKPVRISGKVTFEVLWWDVSYSFDRKLTDEPAPVTTPVDPVVLLREQLANPRVWEGGALPTGAGSVRLKEDRNGQKLLLHPLQPLSFLQDAVPFEQTIEKVGGRPSTTVGKLKLKGAVFAGDQATVTPRQTDFAPGAFRKLSQDQLFSTPAYTSMVGGGNIDPTTAISAGASTSADNGEFEELLLGSLEQPAGPKVVGPTPLDLSLQLASGARQQAVARRFALKRAFQVLP